MTQLRTSASEVLVRELERAGARIRSKTQGAQEHRDLLRDVPNHLVASVLGPALVASLDISDQELMRGAFSLYSSRVAQLLAAAQAERNRQLQGYLTTRRELRDLEEGYVEDLNAQQDKNNRDAAVALLLGGLVTLGLSKLYDPAPDAVVPGRGEFDGLLVPATLVRQATDRAGGELDEGGVGTGKVTKETLSGAGVHTRGYVWVYGPAIRLHPFDSHEELDGQPFSSWDDEVLAVQEKDQWLNLTDEQPGYHPDDHIGCLCAVAFVLDDDVAE